MHLSVSILEYNMDIISFKKLQNINKVRVTEVSLVLLPDSLATSLDTLVQVLVNENM